MPSRELTGELIRRQAASLRGVDIGERRAEELAVDIARVIDAVGGARERLDFNDEPARFDALLRASARDAAQRT